MGGRRGVFLDQVRSAAGRSPLYDALWRRLADEPFVDELVEQYRWDTPLRLSAALHYLVLGGEAGWNDVDAALGDHAEFIRRFVVEKRIQTNEVQRSWILLPCLVTAAARAGVDTIDLIEIGSSAGLNLVLDRYRYRYEGGSWGSADARLELSGIERSPVPTDLLRRPLHVRDRIGVDIAPLNVSLDENARLLKSFVWPDQTWRLELLDRAISELRLDPPQLVRGDAADVLPGLLDARRHDALTVVVQTAVVEYMPDAAWGRVLAALDGAGSQGNLAFLSTARPREDEHTFWGLWLRVWPGEPELLAHADFHGAWIEWRGAAG